MDLNAVFLSEDMLTAPETQTMGKHALKNISDAYAEQQDVAASPEAGRNLSREEEELKTTLTKEKALEFVKEVQVGLQLPLFARRDSHKSTEKIQRPTEDIRLFRRGTLQLHQRSN